MQMLDEKQCQKQHGTIISSLKYFHVSWDVFFFSFFLSFWVDSGLKFICNVYFKHKHITYNVQAYLSLGAEPEHDVLAFPLWRCT